MREPAVPKGETAWMGYYDTSHNLRFLVTSKSNNREFYFLYEVVDGALKKLGKSRSPKELEDKHKVHEWVREYDRL